MTKQGPIRLGLIGCGQFGRFCLRSYGTLPEVRIVAVADVRADAADALAEELGVRAYHDPADLIAAGDIDMVHIASPPSSHYGTALAALAAGKHVLCEKPLAINTREGDELVTAAKDGGLVCPVDFVLRYNQITEAVKRVIDSGVLGKVLAGRFTNCAKDTPIPTDHWFWDKSISGGIFIEHAVHFFDLYRYWLGLGKVIAAHAELREGTGQEDRVQCTIRYDTGALVSHYHGFDQIEQMDRQHHRLVCEMGDICVDEWIPITLTVEAAVDDEGAAALADVLPGAEVELIEEYAEDDRNVMGRGKQRSVTKRVRLRLCPNPDKMAVYAESVRDLLADQIAGVRDPSHARRITERNGRDALALAEDAASLAESGGQTRSDPMT